MKNNYEKVHSNDWTTIYKEYLYFQELFFKVDV